MKILSVRPVLKFMVTDNIPKTVDGPQIFIHNEVSD